MRSDVYHDERHRDQLNEFFKDFNEKRAYNADVCQN